jgi:hypothetical protein
VGGKGERASWVLMCSQSEYHTNEISIPAARQGGSHKSHACKQRARLLCFLRPAAPLCCCAPAGLCAEDSEMAAGRPACITLPSSPTHGQNVKTSACLSSDRPTAAGLPSLLISFEWLISHALGDTSVPSYMTGRQGDQARARVTRRGGFTPHPNTPTHTTDQPISHEPGGIPPPSEAHS